MIRHQTLFVACAVLLLSGCNLFHKKSASQPKDSPHIASQVEQEFEQRWVVQRTAELTAKGLGADAARAQAVEDFRQKFSATKAAQDAR